MYVLTDNDGRVRVCYDCCAPAEAVEVAEPDGWDWERIFDWVLADGALVYDPMPAEPTPPEPVEVDYDAALVELAGMLDDALAQMDEQGAALVELAGIIADMAGGDA